MEFRQRGFTLVEVLVGASIAFFIIWGLVALASRYAQSAASLNARLSAQSSGDRLLERMSTEASSAWAVFVPQNDVLGASNADGHEVDFFSEDGAHRPYAWAYTFERASKAITRYAYAPGGAPLPGETFEHVDTFAAAAANADDVSVAGNAAYDPLFAGAVVPRVRYAFAELAGAQGGNGIVQLALAANGVRETEVLAAETAPTTFTLIVAYTPAPSGTPTPGPLPTLTPTPP